MDENDRFDSPDPRFPTSDVDPLEPKIVEATPVPEYGGYVGDTTPPLGAVTPGVYATNAPTEAIPVVERVVPPVFAPTTVSPAAYAPWPPQRPKATARRTQSIPIEKSNSARSTGACATWASVCKA